jgi:hypothetical protein
VYPVRTIQCEGIGGGTGPEIQPLTGEDFVYIFIDTIPITGYSANLPLGADYMVKIEGRYNSIISHSYYEWTGTSSHEWSWRNLGSIEVIMDSIRLETEIEWEKIGIDPINENFDVYFMTTDWREEVKDYSNLEGVIRGPTKGYISEGETRGYDVKYHGTYDAYFEESSWEVLFETKEGSFLSWQLPSELKLEDGIGDQVAITSLSSSDFEISETKAQWTDIYSNAKISVEHLFVSDMLKENIVIEEKVPIPQGEFDPEYLIMDIPIKYSHDLQIFIDGDEYQGGVATSDDIIFYSNGEPVYSIMGPYAIDANQHTIQCEYVFFEGEATYLRLRTSFSWLAKAQYPVAIDPSVTYTLENDHITWDDDESEQLGKAVVVGDFDDDGYADVAAGAPFDAGVGGSVYVFLGPFSGDDDTPDVKLYPLSGNLGNLGGALAVGDFNNDGVDDLAVGGDGGADPPDVFIFYGGASFTGLITSEDVRVPRITGKISYGFSLGTGDLNPGTDSNDDLLVGVLGWNNGNSDDNGRVVVYLYDSSDWGDGTVSDSPDAYLVSDDKSKNVWEFGNSIATGDMYSPNN